jgi:hypothetical protein
MRSIFLLGAIVAAVIGLAYFGYGAYSERSVYSAVVNEILRESKGESVPISKMNVFVSRPLTCSTNDIEDKLILRNLLAKYTSANNRAKPIPLTALEGIVPVLSLKDTNRLHRANYSWSPKGRNVVWVSRVGFNTSYSEAIICLATIARHQFVTMLHLRRENGEWKINGEYIASLST